MGGAQKWLRGIGIVGVVIALILGAGWVLIGPD